MAQWQRVLPPNRPKKRGAARGSAKQRIDRSTTRGLSGKSARGSYSVFAKNNSYLRGKSFTTPSQDLTTRQLINQNIYQYELRNARSYASGRASFDAFDSKVFISEKDLQRVMEIMDRYRDKRLKQYAQAVWYRAATLPKSRMTRALPRGATGRLRASVKARKNKLRTGEIAASTVGPKARHRNLVILGTSPHSLEGGSGKYGSRGHKSKTNLFPDRGKKYNLRKVEIIGPIKGREPNYNGQAYVAIGKYLRPHPGTSGTNKMDVAFMQMEPQIMSFIDHQLEQLQHTGIKSEVRMP